MAPEVMSMQDYVSSEFGTGGNGVTLRSALDHIELTHHDVTVFAIPEFKSLEVLEKICLH